MNRRNIVIIGAGMAGLNCCYQLKKAGYYATIYEASNRIGGRMFTAKGLMGDGLTTDLGGEFVDTDHDDIITLVKDLGLQFYDLNTNTTLEDKLLYFNGLFQQKNNLLAQSLMPFAAKIQADIVRLPDELAYKNAAAFQDLDQLSIPQYLDKIGIQGWLRDFFYNVMSLEFAMEASNQTALNLLTMLELPTQTSEKNYHYFTPAHEVLKIKGGSQALTDALYEKLKDRTNRKYTLLELNKTPTTQYELIFEHNNKRQRVLADDVVLTIPFTKLREVKRNFRFSAQKEAAIATLGYGNATKFMLGFKERVWEKMGATGNVITDLPFRGGWDNTQMQGGQKGGFTIFAGGKVAETVAKIPKKTMANDFLDQITRIFPQAKMQHNGIIEQFVWADYPFSKSSYSSYLVGQSSTFGGAEGEPFERIYFAGEHTSLSYQGYMNGAAETGGQVAAIIAGH